MIIEETDNAYDFHVTPQTLEDGTPVIEIYQESGSSENYVGIDKHQAAQLVEALQKWLAGEEVE